MKKKILLVSLRDPFLDNDRVMPPIGIMSLQSYMLSCGFDSTLENNFDLEHIEKYKDYTHIGISCMTPQKVQAYEILNKIKGKYPHIKVILGGPHAKYYTEDCVEAGFDYIVVGDGEFALKDIIYGKKDLPKIIYGKVSQIEMNTLPPPYREKEFLIQYNFDIQGKKASTILTAKGCPMKCTFCEDAGTKVSMYNVEHISRQIQDIKDAGFEGVMFFDDIFAISKKRIKELAPMIKKHNIIYRCFGHAKSMDDEMAILLAESGCIETGFGAESGSQKILDIVGKKTTVEQNQEYVKICNRYGIKVKAFLIVGLPGEDYITIKETEKFLDFLLKDKFVNKFGKEITNDFDITIYFPYKGTEIRDSIDRGEQIYDLMFTIDPDEMSGFYKGKGGEAEATVRTSALDREEIIKIQKELLMKYKKRVTY